MYNTMREAFYALFTDDPIVWIKWIIVFAILVGGYVIAIKLYGPVSCRISRERKADIAKSLGHVIEAKLVSEWFDFSEEENNKHTRTYYCHAKYEYTLDGMTRIYKALFRDTRTAPRKLTLYYIKNPRRVFGVSDWHYENHKGFVLIPIIALPWILAAAAMILLRIPMPQ